MSFNDKRTDTRRAPSQIKRIRDDRHSPLMSRRRGATGWPSSFVVDLNQVQAAGRGGVACFRAALGFENSFDIVGLPASGTDMQERADNAADHVVQEAVRLNIEQEEIATPLILITVFAADVLEWSLRTFASFF